MGTRGKVLRLKVPKINPSLPKLLKTFFARTTLLKGKGFSAKPQVASGGPVLLEGFETADATKVPNQIP